MARIFISREVNSNSTWVEWANSLGHEVIGISCIQTQPIKTSENPSTDWIFFSSSEGAKYYFQQCSYAQQKVAAMGTGTAETLVALGVPVHWTGRHSDPTRVARDFRSILSDHETVLFPQSAQTKNSIAPLLDGIVTLHQTVYETVAKAIPQQDCDIWIFSSPSNVHSYHQQHQLSTSQSHIAFGPTTAKALESLGVQSIQALEKVDDNSLIEAIKECLLG